MPSTTITPVTLYFTTAPSTTMDGGGATYTNVQIPTTLNGTTLTQDQRVLTYALAAELLEFQLYLQAYLYVTGQSITIGGTTYSTVTDALGYTYGAGNTVLASTGTTAIVASYLQEFAQIEYNHGQFLITALGGNPYPSGVAFAFGLHTLTTPVEVAQAVYGAELTGVSAYLGAIPSFTPKSPYLQIAASIQGTEARHTAALAAAINTADSNSNIETAPFYNEGLQGHGIDVPLTPDQILNTGGGGVPGVLTGSGPSATSTGPTNPAGGTITPVSGPSGAAVGAANGTTAPIYNGYVYLLS